ncbi:MAG: hypothetical protein JO179_02060 [Solirubrobacterales bacterium]|nr:hypothetical protein [Solirubrobacterales bacterium]
MLRLAGVEPETKGVQGVVTLAEGWPAALYLAALVLREDPQGLAEVGGQHHLLLDYLRDEVLSDLPPDHLSFSRRTSVLDELSGPSCDAVLGEHRSALLLEQLARLSPLLMPGDPAHASYRWHPLVLQALRMDLERIEPELVPEIRIRASDWYVRRGDTCRALGQAAAAGAAELTGKLLWPNILDYLTRGRNDLVRDWLRNFPTHLIAEHTPLALSAALSALWAGNVADALRPALAAGAGIERGGSLHQVDSLRTGVAVIEAFVGHDGIRRMRELATRATECEPDDSQWQPMCCLLRGVAEYLLGNRDDADLVLDEGIRLSGNGTPELTCLCLAQRAMIAIDGEEWELAVEVSDAALMLVEDSDLRTEPLLAIVFAAAAAARAHAGRIDEAKRDARHGADLLAEFGDFVPWYGAEVRILLAHASLWLADAVGARTLLAEASRCARKTRGAAVFSDWFDRAWSYMDTLAESKLTGPSSLTIAELRILRFLPSHRSFREIAAQLGVSANTVKTQAHSVYRKLGAASRSEAVSQARAAGLLGM